MQQDRDLIQDFASSASQEAFGQIVQRHINLVYAAARRQVGDRHLAEDVTQAVFVVLAQKALKVASSSAPLVGWLLKTTRFACLDVIKRRKRQAVHEQRVAQMNPTVTQNDLAEEVAQRLSPELDGAMARLNDGDRGVIALRYLEDKSIADVAGALGISQEAASKRITRAADRLRRILLRGHKDVLPAAVPITAVLNHLILRADAPMQLSHAVLSAATSSASASTSVLTITKGVTNMIMWSKAKAAAAVIGVICAVGAAGLGTVSLVRAQNRTATTQSSGEGNPVNVIVTGGGGARVVGGGGGGGFGVGGGRVINLQGGGGIPGPSDEPPNEQADPLAYTAHLKNGVWIELLGVCEHPSKDHPWWRADGSPMPHAPYDHLAGQLNIAGANIVVREVALRVHTIINGKSDRSAVLWDRAGGGVMFGGSMPGGAPMDAANKRVAGLDGMIMTFLDSPPDGGVIRADVASEGWKTVATAAVAPGELKWNGDDKVPFQGTIRQDPRETHLMVSRPQVLPTDTLRDRIVAVDRDGNEQVLGNRRMSSDGVTLTMDMVARMPRESIKEVRYQQRKYDSWIEIRNVSVNPGQLTQVQVVTSDDPPAKAEEKPQP
ncbi:MAG TPA: sigma-70 family RNA polymerase sigma factor [Tepidisphaeraceae bacterium]|jgi:RNA polymerase sigma factor (sigma-70 family)